MENKLNKENKRCCQHWYFKKIIDDIFESNDKKKLEDILNEIAIYFNIFLCIHYSIKRCISTTTYK